MKIITLVHIFLSYIFSTIMIFIFLFPGAGSNSFIANMMFAFLILFLGTSISAHIVKRQISDYEDYKEILLFSAFLGILLSLFVIFLNEETPPEYYLHNPLKILQGVLLLLPYFLASSLFLKPQLKDRNIVNTK
jgi:membrane-associated HD superfamily phosphohydrolase